MIEIGLTLITLGFVLVIIGVLTLAILALRKAVGREGVRGAGVILVGPVPIVLASDKEMVKWGVLLTAIAALLFLVLILLSYALTKP